MLSRRVFPTIVALVFSALIAGDVRAAGDPYKEILKVEFGDNREAFTAIDDEIQRAAPEAYPAIEKKLLAALGSPDASIACKRLLCRRLKSVASENAVPVLVSLLGDPKVADMARYALEAVPGAQADAALRRELGRLQGNMLIGVIDTIGERGDKAAIPELAKLAGGPDAAAAEQAIFALGRIGGGDAAKALSALKTPEQLTTLTVDALLRAADKMLAEGDAAGAAGVYRGVLDGKNPGPTRGAALVGLARSEKEKAIPTALTVLKSGDPALERAACACLEAIPGEEVAKVFAGALPALSPAGQVALLSALGDRGGAAALPAMRQAMKHADSAVRVAAIRAVGKTGGVSEIDALAAVAAQQGAEGEAAVAALSAIRGEGVDEALIRSLGQAAPDVAPVLILVLGNRRATKAVPALFEKAADPDPKTRAAACKALGALAAPEQMPSLLSLLIAAKSDPDREALKDAVVAAASRQTDTEKRAVPILSVYQSASPEAKAFLLRALGNLAGDQAFAHVQRALKESNPKLRDAAVRALADWPGMKAAETLLNVAQSTENQTHAILALRAYLQKASSDDLDKKEAMEMFKKAAPLVQRDEEKKVLLAGLANCRTIESLNMTLPYLDDPAVNAEASAAVLEHQKGLVRDHREAYCNALKKVLATCKNKEVCKEAEAALKEAGG